MQLYSKTVFKSSGKVSGPVVVLILFSGAFFLFGLVFFFAYQQKLSNQGMRSSQSEIEFTDSATTREAIHSWMTQLPVDWIKVTKVESQGFVVFIPCYAFNATLTFQDKPDSLPRVVCEHCDNSTQFSINSIAQARSDSAWEFRLLPAEGKLRLVPVNDSLLLNFTDAPFRDKILLWTRSQDGGRVDTMIFVPKTQESEFEILRAEDENPEGCGNGDSD